MKKNHDFRVKSDKRCKVCNTPLKQNLIDKIPGADLCFRHFMRDVRKNPRYQNA